jgi:hypothetical protein
MARVNLKQLAASGASNGQTLAWASSGSTWVPTAQTSGGYPSGVRQIVSSFTSVLANTTNLIPADDTIPQSSEGAQFLSVPITPQSGSSFLKIDVIVGAWSANSVVMACGAIFRDATANAIAAALSIIAQTGTSNQFQMSCIVAAGSTATTTFKFRMGLASGSATLNFNGYPGPVRYFGGVCSSGITVTEFGA